jgi:hypothetical protein
MLLLLFMWMGWDYISELYNQRLGGRHRLHFWGRMRMKASRSSATSVTNYTALKPKGTHPTFSPHGKSRVVWRWLTSELFRLCLLSTSSAMSDFETSINFHQTTQRNIPEWSVTHDTFRAVRTWNLTYNHLFLNYASGCRSGVRTSRTWW